MSKLAAFSPAYFPSLEHIWYMVQADHIVLTDHFQFTKRSTLTRSAGLNSSDPVLSIPVQHSGELRRICDVHSINEIHWRKKHYSNIYHQFHSEPYAYFYLPQIKDLIFSATENVSDYIAKILKQLIEWLHFETKIYQASKIGFQTKNFDSVSVWCRNTSCTTYLYQNDALTKQWLNENDFREAQIKLEIFKPYPAFHILESNRFSSVLSFLLQYGPEAGYIMRQYQSKL